MPIRVVSYWLPPRPQLQRSSGVRVPFELACIHEPISRRHVPRLQHSQRIARNVDARNARRQFAVQRKIVKRDRDFLGAANATAQEDENGERAAADAPLQRSHGKSLQEEKSGQAGRRRQNCIQKFSAVFEPRRPHSIPNDAFTDLPYSRAFSSTFGSSTVNNFRSRITTRPPITTVSTSLAFSEYAICA